MAIRDLDDIYKDKVRFNNALAKAGQNFRPGNPGGVRNQPPHVGRKARREHGTPLGQPKLPQAKSVPPYQRQATPEKRVRAVPSPPHLPGKPAPAVNWRSYQRTAPALLKVIQEKAQTKDLLGPELRNQLRALIKYHCRRAASGKAGDETARTWEIPADST